MLINNDLFIHFLKYWQKKPQIIKLFRSYFFSIFQKQTYHLLQKKAIQKHIEAIREKLNQSMFKKKDTRKNE